MIKATRVLYGLHETLVLMAYERGPRRARLVLRARQVAEMCRLLRDTAMAHEPMRCGAPIVVGEVVSLPNCGNPLRPVIWQGAELHYYLKRSRAEWCLRHHRISPVSQSMVRFESGTRAIYGTYTAIFAISFLLSLIEGDSRETKPSTGLP